MPLSPINKLDKFLKILRNCRLHQASMRNIIGDSDNHISYNDFNMLANKLIKDGYLEMPYDYSNPLVDTIYALTFEGLVFHQQGGYSASIMLHKQEKARLIRNDKLLIRSTWFAGVAAILVLLWQIFIYLYPVHKDFPLFIWQK